MATITGELNLVTDQPDTVTGVSVRAKATRPQNGGLTVAYNVPVSRSGGTVKFDALPGPAVLALSHAIPGGGVTTEAIEIIIGDENMTLEECVRNAEMAGGRDVAELAAILEEIRASVGVVTGALDGVVTGGDTQVTRVTSTGSSQVSRVTTAGSNAVATVKSAIVSTVEDRDRAESAAAGAEDSASQAADDRRQTGEDRVATGEDRSQTGVDRGAAESAAAVSATGLELVGQHLSEAESAAARAEQAVESTRWEGDRLTVMGQTSPPLRGPALTWADLTQEQLDALRGPRGRSGADGADGKSVSIAGSVPTLSELPDDAPPGEGWITADDGHLHVRQVEGWTDVGEIRGPQGEPGPALTWDDLTQAQKASLEGEQGIPGRQGDLPVVVSTVPPEDTDVIWVNPNDVLPGQPDVTPMNLSGTGFPEGVVAAPVGAVYTDTEATAGATRWIKTTGTGATGWTTDVVHTGVRNIASLMSEYMSSTWALNLSRRNVVVQASLYSRQINKKNISSGDVLFTLPVGFRPETSYRFTAVQPSIQMEVSTSGVVTALGSVPQNSYMTFSFVHTTADNAPATFPGNPA